MTSMRHVDRLAPGSEHGADVNGKGESASDREIEHQRRTWEERADTWDLHNSAGMHTVAQELLSSVAVAAGAEVVDLGCGTGRLALELAQKGARVLAVDVSQAMVAELESRAADRGLPGVTGLVQPIERLSLAPDSCDLVVSNYALHHLRDADKVRLVREAYRWLRPGGSFAVADMMFGRGAQPEDRAIIAAKVRALAKKGVPGMWRIAKNAFRFMARVHEQPLSRQAWQRLLAEAGYVEVTARPVVAEAGIALGRKPG